MTGYEEELERERERREELECELDQMRKRLQESLLLLECHKSLDTQDYSVSQKAIFWGKKLKLSCLNGIQSGSMTTLMSSEESTPQYQHSHLRPKSRSSKKRVPCRGSGGTFVRIGHV